MKLIVGLGNPGEKYHQTRHNVGFMAIDQIQQKLKFDDFKEEKKLKALVTKGKWQEESIILAKPTTFMNLSGEAVISIANFYKIPLNDIWIIYDDVDLELGRFRIRTKGSAGTHNGMKSIINSLGNTDFVRFKIGIESRGVHSSKQEALDSFVLSKFKPAEIEIIKTVLKTVTDSVISGIEKGIVQTMNSFN